MAEATPNLQLPLLEGSDFFSKEKYNAIVEAVDEKCLPITHRESNQHWTMWKPNKTYGLKDVVRTSTTPTWGFLECTQPGISSITEPTGLVGEGDTKVDGTVAWILRRLGSGVIKHSDLTGRQLADQHPISAITGLQETLAGIHTHTNKPVLDKLSEDTTTNKLKYNGELVGVSKDVWGGEYATHQDLANIANPVPGYNYIVTADETKGGQRSYYTYTEAGVFQYLGAFVDGIAAGGTTAVGGVTASSQWSSSNLMAVGTIKEIGLTNNPIYNFVAPTVLKEEMGSQDLMVTVNTFDNGEATSFKFDSAYVEFVGGVMKVRTSYPVAFTNNSSNPDCAYSRVTINKSQFKNIEGVVV